MARKTHYRTKQMTEVVDFLRSVPGRHVTVNDIYDHFKKEGIEIGMTTIYRHLERLVQQGLVAKYTIEGISSACFQYIAEEDDSRLSNYYHCKCEKCGRLFHIQCDRITRLEQHMTEDHGFELNALRTVFYGTCSECRSSDR
ncbi:MAG: Fur family transcriptional regulator [Anaerovoracaceae bacterium]